jgi:hypothetical protein
MEAAPESQLPVPRPASVRLYAVLSITLALAAGLGLRLWMLKQFFDVDGDPLVYGGLAKNLLLAGRYALTAPGGEIYCTLIRLPGYPLFLALCFRLFGMENYVSAAWVQIPLDLAGCLLLADFAGRIVPVLARQIAPVSLRFGSASPSESALCSKFAFSFRTSSRGGSEFHNGTTLQREAAFHRGAAHCTLWLAALCPFTAIYAAQPLTESLTLFVLALALWSVARFCERPVWSYALWFTFSVTYAALLRPDGALIGVVLALALVMSLRRAEGKPETAEKLGHKENLPVLKGCGFSRAASEPIMDAALAPVGMHIVENKFPRGLKPRSFQTAGHPTARKAPRLVRMALVCTLLALAPFAAWSWRNWQVFHVFQPLAPRLANDPGEETHPGWEGWVKSWCLDFVSTYDVYWPVPGSPLDLTKLPNRAFDSPAQLAETATLAADYNSQGQSLTPAIDARFGRLAEERDAAHPLRSALWLPLGRMADMWLRPRVENLPIDLDWWVYEHHDTETLFSWAYVGLNALYLLLGLAGLCMRPRFWGPMLAYFLLRSALLMTVEAPESRYTIECFPMLFALGGVALHGAFRRCTTLWQKRGSAAS